MVKQGVEFDEVFDKFAIRIIVNSLPENEKSDCWRIYSIVTDYYKCTMCGEETRQYINGSIKYLKLDDRDREFIQKEKEIDEKDG